MPSLLAERARSECARSMRAVEGDLDHSLQYWGRGIEKVKSKFTLPTGPAVLHLELELKRDKPE